MACNCPSNNCTCGCQSLDPCGVSSGTVPCSSGEPCAQTQSTCGDAVQQECCTNCNLFVQTTQAFNMPACDGTGNIFVDDASRLYSGAVIYAEGVGYLTVVEILDASEVVVRNNCPECALQVLDPGSPVPSGTQFGVGIPFCASEGDVEFSGPRLNSDYFIPAVSACVMIAVTSIEGLAIGDTVTIGTNRYRINDIPTTTSMEICNDGEGGEPGVLVQKDANGDGILDYPILRISSVNPCTADPVDAGRLLVCSTGSTQQAMEGTIENQVPAWNPTSEQFELKVMDGLATCVTLVCCLTLDPQAEECDEYLIDVLPNTEKFTEAIAPLLPNPLRISINGDKFCVTEVVDSNTLRIVPAFPVTEIAQYEEGAVVCIDECCVQCVPHILTMDDSGGGGNCTTPEILIGTGILVLDAEVGIFTNTLPASLAENTETGFEEEAEYLWKLDVMNDACCDCRKYFEVTSNFETAVSNGNIDDLFINVEFRILRTAPTQNSQSFAGMPFTSARETIVSQTPDLIPGFQSINTFKGTVYDRGFVNPGEVITLKGHIRIVTENLDNQTLNFSFLANWRIWVKLWNFGCASVDVDLP
jgi:hypothetical protein